jgi:hypothetical protein
VWHNPETGQYRRFHLLHNNIVDMAPRTQHGSCHCGAVKFSALLDLAEKGTVKCNCTICVKIRSWEALTKPEDFTLIQGEADLTKYTYNKELFPHYFCKHCGVHTHLTGTIPELGDQVFVQVNCLDDAKPQDLAEAPVRYLDNLNDTVSDE